MAHEVPEQEKHMIKMLINESLDRLAAIESDIKMLLEESADGKNPFANSIKVALAEINPEAQMENIKKSRRSLRLVDAKLDIDEFSDEQAQEICDILDEVTFLARNIAGASKTYAACLNKQAENN